jgi:predicted secreted protein
MDTAAQWLLIIVSSVLSLFLIFMIIALVYFIKLIKEIRRLAEKADNVAGSVEAAAGAFERAASPLAVLKIIGNIIDQASKIRKGKG